MYTIIFFSSLRQPTITQLLWKRSTDILTKLRDVRRDRYHLLNANAIIDPSKYRGMIIMEHDGHKHKCFVSQENVTKI